MSNSDAHVLEQSLVCGRQSLLERGILRIALVTHAQAQPVRSTVEILQFERPAQSFSLLVGIVSGEGQLDRSRSSLFLRCARFPPLQCRQLQIGDLLRVGLSIRCFLQFALFDSLGRAPIAQSISSHSRCRRRPELRARSALRKAAKLSTGSDFCSELIHRTSRSIALTEAGRDFY